MKILRTLRIFDIMIFFALALLSFLLIKSSASVSGDTVSIHTERGDFQYPLEKDGIYKVTGPLGETTVQVQDKKVRITDSPCSGKTCVAQGWHSPVVCLPNKVIIIIEKKGDFDAVSE